MIVTHNPISFEAHSFQISLALKYSDEEELLQIPYFQRKFYLGLKIILFIIDQAFAE
jgi:hypothetical protein